jgi:hypothetical protein
MLCPHCGTANLADANFCSRCGTDLRTDAGKGTGAEDAHTRTTPSTPLPTDQPWLRADFAGEDDLPVEPPEPDIVEDVDAGVDNTTELPAVPGRLVSGVQGLLEPIRVAAMPGEGSWHAPGVAPVDASLGLDADHVRRIRTLMLEEPLLAAAQPSPVRGTTSLWVPWVFLVIGLALAIPAFVPLKRPTGVARQWPGVQAAFAVIDGLPAGSSVQIFWAYDPATAGEMDLVAAPVVRHLMDRGANMSIVSLLPNGPATARRLFAQVAVGRGRRPGGTSVGELNPRFLPGGVMVLPALGQEPAALAVVFAAQADDVQAWLEQVAPRNKAAVVAATGAGADPPLRPYWESGQLVGLVSGFDGAASYTALLDQSRALVRPDGASLQLQLVGQNIALLVFFAIILGGNLAALLGGRRGNE